MTTSEVGASTAQTTVPGAQRIGAKNDSGTPADVFAALLGMVGLTPAPVPNPVPVSAPVSAQPPAVPTGSAQSTRVSHGVRPSNSAPSVSTSLTVQGRSQRMPTPVVLADRGPMSQPMPTRKSASKPDPVGVEQEFPVRTPEPQVHENGANGRHEDGMVAQRPSGKATRTLSQRESLRQPALQPQVLPTGKPALQTQAAASLARPSGMAPAPANAKPAGATPLSVLLAQSGVPTSDVTNVSFVKRPVPASDKPAVSTEAWRLQHGGSVSEPPSEEQSKKPTVQLLNVHSTVPHVHSTATEPQAMNSDAPQWSVLNTDAHRQFAALLAQHTAKTDGSGTLTVQVHPQGLGTITVTVAQQPGGLSVQIQATNLQTAQWLQTETQRLTQAVQMAGIPVTGVQVGLPDSGTGDSRNQNSGTDRRSQSFGGRKAVTAAVAAPGVAAASSGTDLTAQSISVRA